MTDMPPEVLSLVGVHLSAVDEARAACVCAVFRDTFVSKRAAIRAELAKVLTVAAHGGSSEEFASGCVRATDENWATWVIDGGIPHRRVALTSIPYLTAPKLTAFVALGPVRFFTDLPPAAFGIGPTYREGVCVYPQANNEATDPSSQHAVKYIFHLSKTLTM
jgi:hypothetical protein